MTRFFAVLALIALAAGCEPPPPPPAPPPAKCECPPAPAADCSDLAAALESCQARLKECEQDPFKGGKYLIGDGPDAGRPAP